MTLWKWLLSGWLNGVPDALLSGKLSFRRQKVTVEQLADVLLSCLLQTCLDFNYARYRREMEWQYAAGFLFDGVSEDRFNAEMAMILIFGTMWEAGKLPMAGRILDSFENKVAACFQSNLEERQRFLRQARARNGEYGDILLKCGVDVALDQAFLKNLLGIEGWRVFGEDERPTVEFSYALKVIASFSNFRSEMKKLVRKIERATKIIES